jgi:non-heme chloroperoxidase
MTTPEERATGVRRHVLLGSLVAAAALAGVRGTTGTAIAQTSGQPFERPGPAPGRAGFIKARDGAEIYYKDWGSGPPIVFSHGWPLNADVWDEQMMFMAGRGFRCVAFDRRGHGRSTQTWDGNDYDTFAADLADLIGTLDLSRVILVGHSAGAGDIARYIGRVGTARVSGVALASAIPPIMLKTHAHPNGVPIEVFDGIRDGVARDRAQFYRDLGNGPFFGANRPGSKISQGIKDAFWLWCMQVGLRASYEGIKAFSETDFTNDLTRFDVSTLIIHGDDDQNVPIAATALLSSKLIKGATLKIYPGAPHGLTVTHKERFNEDLLVLASSVT